MSSENLVWIDQSKKLFATSFLAWCLATSLVLVKLVYELIAGFPFPTFILQQLLAMLAALPGVLYFFVQSRKLNVENLVETNLVFDKIMRFQKPTAIAAIVGGVLGFLPFLANFIGFFYLIGDEVALYLWVNIELLVPWISLYGFITFSSFALALNRQRLRQRSELH